MVPLPLRSWSLGRRSGRVATAPDPPPKPSSIVAFRDGRGNDLAGRDQEEKGVRNRKRLLHQCARNRFLTPYPQESALIASNLAIYA